LEVRVGALSRWIIGASLWVPALVVSSACGNKGGGTFDTDDGGEGPPPSSDDASASPPPVTFGDGSSVELTFPDTGTITGINSKCKGGHYDGTFTGSYSSHLTLIGIAISVSGNVSLNLDQVGNPMTTCTLNGESEDCSNLFTLANGTITGVADGNDAGGGFPYFCTMTGTLDCAKAVLVDGWIECTYCVGALNDGGMSCAFGGSGGGMAAGGETGLGGQFAGVLTASYDYSNFSFVNGGWNGAEALAGNNGMMPGPDGGPPTSYLNFKDGGYGLLDFGGAGAWNATYDHP
jgi:hypothetical protein